MVQGKKTSKHPYKKGELLRMCIFLMVVFGILGNRGYLRKFKGPCMQASLSLKPGMPGFFEVVLRPKIILKVL